MASEKKDLKQAGDRCVVDFTLLEGHYVYDVLSEAYAAAEDAKPEWKAIIKRAVTKLGNAGAGPDVG